MGRKPYIPKSDQDIRVVRLYNDEVTITYKNGRHTYSVEDPANGVNGLVLSVTQVLNVLDKPALVSWAVNCGADYIRSRFKAGEELWLTQEEIDRIADGVKSAHRKVSKAARDIGSEAHDWIASCIAAQAEGGDAPVLPENPAVKNCCVAAKNWLAEVGLRPIAIEEIVYSRKHKYLGCMDAAGGLVEIRGRKAVIDWKSSKGLYNEYRFQLAAYRNAYEEMTGLSGFDRYVVRLGKNDGSFEPFLLPDEDYEGDLAAFLGLIPVARRLKELGSR
jgi:hypothetical protein